jgi:hypothetical protein
MKKKMRPTRKQKKKETQKATTADNKRTYPPHHLALPASQ